VREGVSSVASVGSVCRSERALISSGPPPPSEHFYYYHHYYYYYVNDKGGLQR
jgi:hypothetical protein